MINDRQESKSEKENEDKKENSSWKKKKERRMNELLLISFINSVYSALSPNGISPRDVGANLLECNIIVSEFGL